MTFILSDFFISCHRYSLKDLDLLGQDMSYVPLQEIGVMKNLRTLGLAAVKGMVLDLVLNNFILHPTFDPKTFILCKKLHRCLICRLKGRSGPDFDEKNKVNKIQV